MNTRARTKLALMAAATTAAMTMAACGDDESAGSSVPSLTITAHAQGDLTVPKTATPGAAKLTLKNEGKGDAEAQLVKIERNYSREEVLGALGKVVLRNRGRTSSSPPAGSA
jgi:hypothetical protein